MNVKIHLLLAASLGAGRGFGLDRACRLVGTAASRAARCSPVAAIAFALFAGADASFTAASAIRTASFTSTNLWFGSQIRFVCEICSHRHSKADQTQQHQRCNDLHFIFPCKSTRTSTCFFGSDWLHISLMPKPSGTFTKSNNFLSTSYEQD